MKTNIFETTARQIERSCETMHTEAQNYAKNKGIEFIGAEVFKTTGKRKKLSKFMASYHRKKVRNLLTNN
jgi:hypothetical protein